MGKQRKNPPCPVFENIRCKYSVQGQKCRIDGCYDPAEIDKFSTINEQYEYRKDFVLNLLKEAGIPLKFDAVIGRGGLLKPLQGGVYAINELMKKDLWNAKHQHVCNLGSLIADEIAHECHCPAFMADPVVVDEMMTRARYTGLPFMKRESIFHALNAKAASRRYARSIGKSYEELNLVVAHLGGGICVSAHHNGKVIDVNNALNGEGPIAPERSGTLPADQLVRLCFSGKNTQHEVMKMLSGNAGCQALLGMKDMREIERHALAGEQPFAEVLEAMLYTVSKQIGAMAVALWGKADAIILTGGIAHSKYCVEEIKKQVEFLAPVVVLPGEGEMRSLAFNALGVLNGELPIQEYV
jgi:butyrate kinase